MKKTSFFWKAKNHCIIINIIIIVLSQYLSKFYSVYLIQNTELEVFNLI